jgi:diguanylate cyclase (GGDEF)-like protein
VSKPHVPVHAQVHPTLAWFHGSFGARVVALFLGLLALVQIASFGAIGAGLSRHARSVLPEQLAAGEQVLKTVLDQRGQTLTEAAKLLAADYGFREAVLSNDRATIGSVLENHGERIGATEVAWLGPDFALRATAGDGMEQLQLGPAAAALAADASGRGSASGLVLVRGQPHQLVLVPMNAPVLVGWVAMGFPVDARLGSDLQRLTSLDLTLLARPRADAPWRSVQSTLDEAAAAKLAAQAWPAEPQAMTSITVADDELGVRGRWLGTASTANDSRATVLALVSLSIDAATRTPRDLQIVLLAITLAASAIFAIGSLYTAGLVTKPLRTLARAAERLGSGDYVTPVHGLDRSDEIGELAQSFESMRVSVAEKQAQILRLAYWDALTGLPNRAQFRDAVIEAIASAGEAQAPVAVLMLDLDRFKHVNDVLGYAFGDQLLQGVAERLSRQVMRDGDLVARLSGDEFAILLRAGDPALAESVARRVSQAFEQPLTLDEHKVDMGAGIGIACWPQDAGDADTLINRAEVAMYAAKQRHQGALMYDPSLDASSAQTLSLLSDLRQAIEHGELRLFLQPKLALATGAVIGAEALVRWQHPTRGLVPPIQFIPFAEQTGFIRALTIWVFEATAQAWRELHADGTMLVLSVNLSVRDLMDQDLPIKLESLLVKHRVPAEAFCLEITESAIMDDPERALGTLNRLAAMGFKLSIDDFGSGQSSYGYLKRLPVDELKIDMAFIRNMDKDPVDVKIVRSIIELAHNLDLSVVAEGVENARIWDLLRDLRCDQAQGYHMGKPMPSAEFRPWSARWVEARGLPGRTAGATLLH